MKGEKNINIKEKENMSIFIIKLFKTKKEKVKIFL